MLEIEQKLKARYQSLEEELMEYLRRGGQVRYVGKQVSSSM